MSGLAGRRVGKHTVREAEPEVQLGEELSESLRELKVRSKALLNGERGQVVIVFCTGRRKPLPRPFPQLTAPRINRAAGTRSVRFLTLSISYRVSLTPILI